MVFSNKKNSVNLHKVPWYLTNPSWTIPIFPAYPIAIPGIVQPGFLENFGSVGKDRGLL
jgi:hypothetical protein